MNGKRVLTPLRCGLLCFQSDSLTSLSTTGSVVGIDCCVDTGPCPFRMVGYAVIIGGGSRPPGCTGTLATVKPGRQPVIPSPGGAARPERAARAMGSHTSSGSLSNSAWLAVPEVWKDRRILLAMVHLGCGGELACVSTPANRRVPLARFVTPEIKHASLSSLSESAIPSRPQAPGGRTLTAQARRCPESELARPGLRIRVATVTRLCLGPVSGSALLCTAS